MVQMNHDVASDIAERMKAELSGLTPQQRQAAQFLLDNPGRRLGPLRELAADASVTPNTLVRLARALGFGGFDQLKDALVTHQARQVSSPLERAAWLDAIADDSSTGQFLRSVADSALANLEKTLSDTEAAKLQQAATTLLGAPKVFVLGVGTLQPVAKLFATLAETFMDRVQAIPTETMLPLDALAQARGEDVLLAMTFSPYRREVVDAVRMACSRNIKVIVLTDSWSSPVASGAEQVFMLPATAPHIFASVISVVAFVEMLMAFVIRQGGDKAAARIKAFHQNRFQTGVYWSEAGEKNKGS